MKNMEKSGKICFVLVTIILFSACGSSGGGGGGGGGIVASGYCYNNSKVNDENNNLCTQSCNGQPPSKYVECLWNCYNSHGCSAGCYLDCVHYNCYSLTDTDQYTACVGNCIQQCPN